MALFWFKSLIISFPPLRRPHVCIVNIVNAVVQQHRPVCKSVSFRICLVCLPGFHYQGAGQAKVCMGRSR